MLYSVEEMLEGSESEVEDMVKSYRDSATELAKFLVVLKQLVLLVTKCSIILTCYRNYETVKYRKMELQSINSSLTLDLTNMRKAVSCGSKAEITISLITSYCYSGGRPTTSLFSLKMILHCAEMRLNRLTEREAASNKKF